MACFDNIKQDDVFYTIDINYNIVEYKFISKLNQNIGLFECNNNGKFIKINNDSFNIGWIFKSKRACEKVLLKRLFDEWIYSYKGFRDVEYKKDYYDYENAEIGSVWYLIDNFYKWKIKIVDIDFDGLYYIRGDIRKSSYLYNYTLKDKITQDEIYADYLIYRNICGRMEGIKSWSRDYKFDEGEIVYYIDKILKIKKRIMKKDEKLHKHKLFLIKEHAVEYLKEMLKQKIKELK